MRAAQVREAARLLDVQRTPDEENVILGQLVSERVELRIGPCLLRSERALPLSLTPKRYLIDPLGGSIADEPRR